MRVDQRPQNHPCNDARSLTRKGDIGASIRAGTHVQSWAEWTEELEVERAQGRDGEYIHNGPDAEEGGEIITNSEIRSFGIKSAVAIEKKTMNEKNSEKRGQKMTSSKISETLPHIVGGERFKNTSFPPICTILCWLCDNGKK
eukprot:RCo015045